MAAMDSKTAPELSQEQIYKTMLPHERIAVACSLHDFAYERVFVDLRSRHPEMSTERVRLETAIRFLHGSEGILRERFDVS